MSKIEKMTEVLTHVSEIMKIANPTKKIHFEYAKEDSESVKRFSDFHRKYHGILPGMEFVYVYDDEFGGLLYAVNVTADSVLTATYELMELISRKF